MSLFLGSTVSNTEDSAKNTAHLFLHAVEKTSQISKSLKKVQVCRGLISGARTENPPGLLSCTVIRLGDFPRQYTVNRGPGNTSKNTTSSVSSVVTPHFLDFGGSPQYSST
jgi:hypothetical protein